MTRSRNRKSSSSSSSRKVDFLHPSHTLACLRRTAVDDDDVMKSMNDLCMCYCQRGGNISFPGHRENPFLDLSSRAKYNWSFFYLFLVLASPAKQKRNQQQQKEWDGCEAREEKCLKLVSSTIIFFGLGRERERERERDELVLSWSDGRGGGRTNRTNRSGDLQQRKGLRNGRQTDGGNNTARSRRNLFSTNVYELRMNGIWWKKERI